MRAMRKKKRPVPDPPLGVIVVKDRICVTTHHGAAQVWSGGVD